MTNLMQVTETAVVSMSSREIAELTGKRHDNVTVVIESLIDAQILTPEIQESKFEHRGNTYKCFLLSKRDSIVVVARLSPEFTATVVDRWQELETQLHQLESEKVKNLERRNLQLIHDLSDNISHIASSMNMIKAAENKVRAMKHDMAGYIDSRVTDLQELSMEMREAGQAGFSTELTQVVTAMLKDLKKVTEQKNPDLDDWLLISSNSLDRYAQERVEALERQAKIQISNQNK
jgi:phage regulator Rha-like protein